MAGASYRVRRASKTDLVAVVRILARQSGDGPTPVSQRQEQMWARMMATAFYEALGFHAEAEGFRLYLHP